jgi:hypothetical protein
MASVKQIKCGTGKSYFHNHSSINFSNPLGFLIALASFLAALASS